MVKFERQTATEASDLPHEFAGEEAVCDTCLQAPDEARHRAWEKQQIADREQASLGFRFVRETGS